MARRATAEAHDDHEGLETPGMDQVERSMEVIGGLAAKPEPKERQIEITLPISVTREIHAFIGDNPIRRKLAPELFAAVRQAGSDAATAAIVGQVGAIFERTING